MQPSCPSGCASFASRSLEPFPEPSSPLRMNWLAHVFLSEPDVEFRLGNLLADVVRGPDREAMTAAFRSGAKRHHAIDKFTDAHEVVRRSRARVDKEHRRFSGVLVDVFYDYILASRWDQYSSQPLDAFTASFYADVRARRLPVPEPAQAMLDRILRHDLLGSYREPAGVERSLRRISTMLASRWRREFDLERSVPNLIAHEAEYARDFAEFFPQLQAHVASPTGTQASS
jgi:acyl carrier protein phosphodiesterase